MQPRLEATHFIEQYNTTEEAHKFADRKEKHSTPNVIDALPRYLEETKSKRYIHTVAVFLIKLK